MKNPLPKLLSFLTGPRYVPEIEWSSKSWTHNVFRLYEKVFGRKYGIRCEVSASWDKGRTVYEFHTLEAAIGHFEGLIRGLIPRAFPVRLYVPILQTTKGERFFASPYLFAIAYDNSGIQSTSSSSPTISLTVSGSDRELIIVSDNGSADAGTTATYNAVSATFVNKQTSVNWSYLYHLTAPATGTHNVVANGSNADMRCIASSYTGCDQSGTLDNSTTQSNASTSSFVPAITTVAANCWIVVGGQNNGGTATASVGTMRQAAGTGRMLGDRGPFASPGSSTMTMGGVGTAAWGACVASIAPVAASSAIKTIDGLAKASVKTVNGLAIASVKTWNGLA